MRRTLSATILSLVTVTALAQTNHRTHDQMHDRAHDPVGHQAPAAAPGPVNRNHVPPDPPAHPMEPMSNEQMAEIMAMDDSEPYGAVIFDRLEWRDDRDALAWKGTASYGGDYDKLLVETEGDRNDDSEHVRSELLWGHAVSPQWNLRTGVRHDSGDGPSRTWAAVGVEGLAPYRVDVEASLYVAEAGRTALRVEASYELYLTQRWILQPQAEADFYGKDDRQRAIGSGLSSIEAGLRLRYELCRELAPYVGVQWTRRAGETADLARASGTEASQTQWVAGVRLWF